MSTKNKEKSRLSLSKKTSPKEKKDNNILSMFKTQTENGLKQKEVIIISESEEEKKNDDNGRVNDDGDMASSPYFNPGPSSKKDVGKGKSRLSSRLSDKIKQNLKNEESCDSDKESEKEFKFKKSVKNNKNASSSKTENKKKLHGTHLAKSSSESHVGKRRKDNDRTEQLTDDVVVIDNEPGERKRKHEGKTRLSLKRSKTDGDVALLQDNTGRDDQTNDTASPTETSNNRAQNKRSKEGEFQKSSSLKSSKSNAFSGNFLAKMKKDIEKHDANKKSKSQPEKVKQLESSGKLRIKETSQTVDTPKNDNISDGQLDKDENKDENSDTEMDTTGDGGEYRVPYYLENFHTILTTVLQDPLHHNLFNEGDRHYIDTFNSLQGTT